MKTTQVQAGVDDPTQSLESIVILSKTDVQQNDYTSFLSNDLNVQKPLLINYPSQENLQEIKNVYNNNNKQSLVNDIMVSLKSWQKLKKCA